MKEAIAWFYMLLFIIIILIGSSMMADIIDHKPLINLAGLFILALGLLMFFRQDRVLDWAFGNKGEE